ncbi:MAG: thioredoxin family protein [Candidatus Sumerlaeota bacterium]|nr:thioredoxin family protein [Candidatus Sumerlaeota bacterium]
MKNRWFLVVLFLCLVVSAHAVLIDEDFNVETSIATRGLMLTYALIFVAGIIVSFTPCVYPMIPITLSIIGARTSGRRPLAGFLHALVFVLGIAVIYSVVGFIGARTGQTFGFLFQQKLFLVFLALFFFAMGLSMMGVFTIQLPARLAGRLQSGANRGGYIGALLLGLVTGIVASPCGSPVLFSVLAIAAQNGREFVGVSLLFAYALGLGMIFLLLGSFPAFIKSLPKSGGWMDDIKIFLGLVIMAVGVYYLKFAMSEFAFHIVLAVSGLAGCAFATGISFRRRPHRRLLVSWAAGALAAFGFAVYMTATIPQRSTSSGEISHPPATQAMPTNDIPSGAPVSAAISSAKEITPDANKPPAKTADTETTAAIALNWLTDEAEALAKARQEKRPVMIDFTADWFAACKQLEKKTFGDPVIAGLLRDYVVVKIDCTEQTNENQALQKKYDSRSLPTVAFISPDGKHRADLTLYKFEASDKFLQRLRKVQP